MTDEGFTCWQQELFEQVADDADDPREQIEWNDFISRHHDFAPFTPAFTQVAEVGQRE